MHQADKVLKQEMEELCECGFEKVLEHAAKVDTFNHGCRWLAIHRAFDLGTSSVRV